MNEPMFMLTPSLIFFCLNPTGELDHLPEIAFYMVGDVNEVSAKAERLAEEQSAAS